MSGFWSWFLVIVIVLAIFNEDKIPAFKKIMESIFKEGVATAKQGSSAMKEKLNQVKTEIDNKKNVIKVEEAEENTPEETEEALKFMDAYIKDNKTEEKK